MLPLHSRVLARREPLAPLGCRAMTTLLLPAPSHRPTALATPPISRRDDFPAHFMTMFAKYAIRVQPIFSPMALSTISRISIAEAPRSLPDA